MKIQLVFGKSGWWPGGLDLWDALRDWDWDSSWHPETQTTGNQSPVQLLVAYGGYEGRAGLFAERELRQKQLLR